MCIVLLGGYPIAVKYIISYYIISHVFVSNVQTSSYAVKIQLTFLVQSSRLKMTVKRSKHAVESE